jgi:hypothetical protein
MAKTQGWRQRLRRGRLGWLGRIEGVEKPVFLLGLGLILYRVWRTRDGSHDGLLAAGRPPASRWRSALGRLRQRLTRTLGLRGEGAYGDTDEPLDEPIGADRHPLSGSSSPQTHPSARD